MNARAKSSDTMSGDTVGGSTSRPAGLHDWQPGSSGQAGGATMGEPAGLIGVLFDDEPALTATPPRRHTPTPSRRSVNEGRRRGRRRRRGHVVTVLAAVVIVVLAVAASVIVRRALDGLGAPDYHGTGTGTVDVQVHSGDTSADIAKTLRTKDVVASTTAFTVAARKSGRAGDFQPGYFQLRHHMSGAAAVALLLDPASRLSTKVTVTEGMIEAQILKLLSGTLKTPVATLAAAAADVTGLGLPSGYHPKSAEGFLFPQTYEYDPKVGATEALQDMTSQFDTVARKIAFSAGAKALKISPYQALIVASMIEAEVRFDADRAKVARVVYNRLAQHIALGFDSTSAYGAKILGQDPTKINFNKSAPYNTRFTFGLPPTPIGNPGEKSMVAAIHPAAGNWLYFVSKDKDGHLFFTNSQDKFDAASTICKNRGWGCT